MIPQRNPFVGMERFGYVEEDNFINYSAGPVALRLDCDLHIITAQIPPEWVDFFPFFKKTAQAVWGYAEADVVLSTPYELHIKYNLLILENYLDYTITFIN